MRREKNTGKNKQMGKSTKGKKKRGKDRNGYNEDREYGIWRLWADIKKEESIGEEIEKEGVIGRRDNNDREEQNYF